MDFRTGIATSLEQLAAPASVQRRIDFPPEEFRLEWEDSFFVLEGAQANPDALANFAPAELAALRRFNDWLWSLPPEPDPMWDRDNLGASPWPEIRARATELLHLPGSRPAT